MKQLVITLFFLLFFSIWQVQAQKQTLYYNINQSELNDDNQRQLKTWLSRLDTATLDKIYVSGHSDKQGNRAYNLLLSEKRANAVKTFLIAQGIPTSVIKIQAYGIEKPISTTLSANRRTELQVKYREAIVEKVAESTTSIHNLNRKMALVPQEFCIDPSKDTVLTCQKGTLIHIKANSFEAGKTPCVTFQVKEVFLKSEMVLENLTTTSNGQILETAGMVYTNALVNGDTLPLLKDITIMVPTDSVREGVKVFDGTRDLHSDEINWTVNNNSVLRNFQVKDLNDCLTYNELWKACYRDSLTIGIDSTQLRRKCWACAMNCFKCIPCEFFFCRVKNFPKAITSIFNTTLRKGLKEKRACWKSLSNFNRLSKKNLFNSLGENKVKKKLVRKEVLSGKKVPNKREEKLLEILAAMETADSLIDDGLITKETMYKCDELETLFKQYNVDNVQDLVFAINQPLMEEFGVTTVTDLLDTLPKSNLENLEVAYQEKKISYEDYNFYIFNSSKLGWKNLDEFFKMPPNRFTSFKVSITPSKTTECKLVFKRRRFVLSGELARNHYYFEGMPKEEEAWLVGIQYINGKPLFAMKLITINRKNQDLEFEELSLEELKEKLKVLDF